MLGNILNTLFINNVNNEYISNEHSQRGIEELVFDQYAELFKNYKGYDAGGINTYSLSTKIKKYIIEKNTVLIPKIRDLKNFYLDPNVRKKNWI